MKEKSRYQKIFSLIVFLVFMITGTLLYLFSRQKVDIVTFGECVEKKVREFNFSVHNSSTNILYHGGVDLLILPEKNGLRIIRYLENQSVEKCLFIGTVVNETEFYQSFRYGVDDWTKVLINFSVNKNKYNFSRVNSE